MVPLTALAERLAADVAAWRTIARLDLLFEDRTTPLTSLMVIIGTLTMFQIPMESLAILLGIDALLDMVRTSVNLIGNCLAPALIARWEREPLRPSPLFQANDVPGSGLAVVAAPGLPE